MTAGQAAEARAPREAGERSAARSKEQKRIEAEQRQARSKARREQQAVVRALEEEIATLEARQAELTGELERPETYEKPGAAVQINRDLMEIIDRLAELNPRWEAEAARLEQLQ